MRTLCTGFVYLCPLLVAALEFEPIQDTRYKIFIAMQTFKVEMIQDNTALQHVKEHELGYITLIVAQLFNER